MDFLKAQLERIRKQLSGLTASQRIAIGLSLAIALVGMWGMIQWAGSARWIPVLDQPLTPEQMQRVSSVLLASGIEHRDDAEQVFIKGDAGARRRAQAILAQNGAMPRDTSLSYKKLLEEQSPFVSRERAQWRELRGLEYQLSSVLREFSGVREARVLLTKENRRAIRNRGERSSAAVNVTMDDGGGMPPKLVESIAHYVAGATRVALKNITITDGLRFYRPPDDSAAAPDHFIDLQRGHEEPIARKIYDQLRHIAGVIVNVHATLRTEDRNTQVTRLDEPKVIQETSETLERSGGSGAVGPGVRPNQNFAITNAGPGVEENKESSTVEFDKNRGGTIENTKKSPGHLESMMASVSVPRSYLERIVRRRKDRDNDLEVTDGEIDAVAAQVLPRIQEQVLPLIGTKDEEQVVVYWHYDPVAKDQLALAQAVSTDYVALAREFGPQAGLGILALFSVFTVMLMARKARLSPATGGGPASAGAGPGGPSGEPELAALGDPPLAVGEAEEVTGILEGREVDEEVVKIQQIVKQIGQLVKEDAAVPVSLLERWIAEGR